MRDFVPQPAGLYDPRDEHDACGVGFVASLHGHASHALLRKAIEAVVNLAHRGAVSADGLSGDGAGVMTQLPVDLLRREAARLELGWTRDEDLAVGMLFLSREHEARAAARGIIEAALAERSLCVLGWRDVPTRVDVLGATALAHCPHVAQVLITRPEGMALDVYDRRLYLARRRIEQRFEASGLTHYRIPSFSRRTIVYKGLMVSTQLGRFYPDLHDPDYRASIAVFHQRYSTNTFPTWSLSQPLRFLSHNGEINTLRGNVSWMSAREPALRWPHADDGPTQGLTPVIQSGGSDAAMLDNVFELLVEAGRDPLHALAMMTPEANEQRADLDPALRAFYTYHRALMEPWDGPAALVFSDGQLAAAKLDRNGLRPMRYWITRDGLVIAASEAGVVKTPPEMIVERGRLGPGQMLAVDTARGEVLRDAQIKARLAARAPYQAWVEAALVRAPLAQAAAPLPDPDADDDARVRLRKVFGYGAEDVEQIVAPMAITGKPPVGSMGDDTPLAALSSNPQLIYRYFKQRFAQVTNPPIDPLRERAVMSLTTLAGPGGDLLAEAPGAARRVSFTSPVLSGLEFEWLRGLGDQGFAHATLDATFAVAGGAPGLARAVDALCEAGARAVDDGAALLILSDRAVGPERAPVPMLLATAALHHHLIRAGVRMRASLVCDTGEVREDHHFACLIGYGASLIHPYLAYEVAAEVGARGADDDPGLTSESAVQRYRAAVEKGLLKVMSKMGISTVSSYCGAQLFEAMGLRASLIERHFTGTSHRLDGVGLEALATDLARFHAEAHAEPPRLREQGLFRFRKNGEYHAFNPPVFKALHKAVRKQSREAFAQYSRLVDERPACNLRDLLAWKKAAEPTPLDEVEPVESIVRRFSTQAMSHGALSAENHELLAVAMNRLGGLSNSGEGGEDPERFARYTEDRPERSQAPWHPQAGDWANSGIKQVASGRFGVTPAYLIAAAQLEIKMAQGSKPGEGGQIPGHKVSAEIARIRRAVPGVTLISPPPHHDIYSIEDLAQLIYDLKRINRRAAVGVKLVSVAGVGTIAAGVAKGYADFIQISGCDGGTGASPLSSIRHAGVPWELGLAETQQVLVKNDLRGRVLLRVDGGMRTGRDVVIAALLGAEAFGFGTLALIASGCVMARRCHTNTCPVGVATQREDLRARFPGRPEHVINAMVYIAEQVRLILSELGARSLDEVIGRVDLLEARERGGKAPLDLSALLHNPDPMHRRDRRQVRPRNDRPEPHEPLDEVVWRACDAAIPVGRPMKQHYPITNSERTVGARLSGEIARQWRGERLAPATFDLSFEGSAGQSFGAFCNHGMRISLIGEAQDYVGKGMHGGEIIISPPAHPAPDAPRPVLVGNTVLYGATGGALHVAGAAGERLCVRNSGGRVVVEGCGDHGCEYMTGGVAVILGATGHNFGAGMSGGLAFVLDLDDDLAQRLNPGMVQLARLSGGRDEALLRRLVERHHTLTGSPRAALVLDAWASMRERFWKVLPNPAAEDRTAHEQDEAAVQGSVLREMAEEKTPSVVPSAH